MTGGWTEDDGEIFMHIARRIVSATVKAQSIPDRANDPESETGLGTHWPERAYRPSQAWFASLNL